jgi:hypothetical protein
LHFIYCPYVSTCLPQCLLFIKGRSSIYEEHKFKFTVLLALVINIFPGITVLQQHWVEVCIMYLCIFEWLHIHSFAQTCYPLPFLWIRRNICRLCGCQQRVCRAFVALVSISLISGMIYNLHSKLKFEFLCAVPSPIVVIYCYFCSSIAAFTRYLMLRANHHASLQVIFWL